jgi:hypothetical protein
MSWTEPRLATERPPTVPSSELTRLSGPSAQIEPSPTPDPIPTFVPSPSSARTPAPRWRPRHPVPAHR